LEFLLVLVAVFSGQQVPLEKSREIYHVTRVRVFVHGV
jgi:hypothetical protein